jgi:hypothetical protein
MPLHDDRGRRLIQREASVHAESGRPHNVGAEIRAVVPPRGATVSPSVTMHETIQPDG